MRRLLGLLALSWAFSLSAAEVGDAVLPDTMALESGETLALNGAGMRKKFFVSVYAAGLYLPAPMQDAADILALDGARAMRMHFVYDEVGRDKIVGGWNDGFRANLDEAAYQAVEPRLEAFNAMFEDASRDDVYEFVYLPGRGTDVILNGKHLGNIEGRAFARALFAVWLGDSPADSRLKRELLGR